MKNPYTVKFIALLALILISGAYIFRSLPPTGAPVQLQTAAVSGDGSGLVAHYTFDDGTAADSSGNGNTGTVSGATQTAGKVGSGALEFDGVDDVVAISHGPALNPSEITISFWIKKLAPISGNNGSILQKNSSKGYRIRPGVNGGLQFLNNGGILSSSGAIGIDAWTHVALVADSVGNRFYVNGVAGSLNSIPYVASASTGNLNIGGSLLAHLLIDDVRIYDRSLTAQEISEISTNSGSPINGSGGNFLTEPVNTQPSTIVPPITNPVTEQSGTCAPNTYYIDFENGNDSNDGKCTGSAWKHSPGDASASGNPKTVMLKPGDTVLFKGGVTYRGTIIPTGFSGTSNSPVTFKGTGWGQERR